MKAHYLSVITISFLLAAALSARAQELTIGGDPFPEISTATLKIRIDTTTNFVLIDVRPREEYAEGHIPGAINVPPDRVERIAEHLPRDKDVPLVFYCRGYV